MSDPQVAVDMAVHAARQAMTDLWHMRLKNETADLLCSEYEALVSIRNMAGSLCEDIYHSLHKEAAE